MKTHTLTKTKQKSEMENTEEAHDPLWEDIKAGLESALHEKLTVWKPKTKTISTKKNNSPVKVVHADWESIKKGFESVKHGKLSVWEPPFK